MSFLSRIFKRQKDPWQIVEGSGWRIRIPGDWLPKPSSIEGLVYFESPDTAKGVYVSTLRADHKQNPAGTSLLDEFMEGERNKLLEMVGYHWTFSEERIVDEPPSVGIVDGYDSNKTYRILNKVIVSPPFIVRGSFHDYDCLDYEASKAFFGPISSSLRYVPIAA